MVLEEFLDVDRRNSSQASSRCRAAPEPSLRRVDGLALLADATLAASTLARRRRGRRPVPPGAEVAGEYHKHLSVERVRTVNKNRQLVPVFFDDR
jgi:hypothetical protein